MSYRTKRIGLLLGVMIFCLIGFFQNIVTFHPVQAAPPFDATSITIAKPGIVKFDWTSGNLDYKGVNANSAAADGDTDWVIYKYTWVSSNPTVIQQRTGSWTLRATYF